MVIFKKYRKTPSLLKSSKAIAIPVTFLILFVSMTLLVTVTYYFSITQINSKIAILKVSAAEQEMVSLEKVLHFVAWSPGSYQIYSFGDYGGTLNVSPNSRNLALTLKDNNNFSDTFFNASIGKIVYELPPSSEYQDNLFLSGDNRVIVNQSNSVMDQVYVFKTITGYGVSISYRPLVGTTSSNSVVGPALNNLKVYIVSLLTSQDTSQQGQTRLKVSSNEITTETNCFNFSSSIKTLTITAYLDGNTGSITVPILSNAQGASVNIETLTCKIEVDPVGWQ